MFLSDFAVIRPRRLASRYVHYRTSIVTRFRHLYIGIQSFILQWMGLYERTIVICRTNVWLTEEITDKGECWLDREDRSDAGKCSIFYACSWLLLVVLPPPLIWRSIRSRSVEWQRTWSIFRIQTKLILELPNLSKRRISGYKVD